MNRSLLPLLLALPALSLACYGGAPDDEALGSAQEEMTVCPAGQTLEGVDVSHYQGTIDWAQVAQSGRAFGIAKATEGTGYVDPKLATNFAGMKSAGVVRGAYCFFHADEDPIAQADHYLATAQLAQGDLPPILDLETTNGQSGSAVLAATIAWLDHVNAMTGAKPILYTSRSFVNNTLGNPAGLDAHAELWLANWGPACPNLPAPFTAWPFWQYSDSGSVPGISGACDVDQFNGTLSDLHAITIGGASSSSSTSSSTSTSGASSSSSTSTGSTSGTSSSSGETSSSGGTSSGAGGASTSSASSTSTSSGRQSGASSGGANETPIQPHKGCGCRLEERGDGDTGALGLGAALASAAIARRRRRAG